MLHAIAPIRPPASRRRTTSPWAIAAFLAATLPWFLAGVQVRFVMASGVVLLFLAPVLALIALRDIRRSHGERGGRALAWTGLTISGLFVLLVVVVILLFALTPPCTDNCL